MQFKVRRILESDIKNEIEKIGFSPSYLDSGVLKHNFLNIKIYNLKPEAATIIKQSALASNCDAALHKGVLDHSIQTSDIILSGTVSELETVCEKLKKQQFSMPAIADKILNQIEFYKADKLLNNQNFRPEIMGILNITKDSFSDGGCFLDTKKAIEHAYKMVEDGAGIIDIGAESTRPGAEPVPSEIEIERLTPVIKELRHDSAFNKVKISVDTRNAITAKIAVLNGADIINDISGLCYDKNMIGAIKETGTNIVIMHSRGTPQDMDKLCNYKNTVDEVYFELLEKVENAINNGIQPHKIIIDAGFGFAKNNVQNFEILKKIEEFKYTGFPVLAGLSRKRFIKSILQNNIKTTFKSNNLKLNTQDSLDELDNLTAQTSFYFTLKKIDIIRVHNVLKTKQAIDLAVQLI